MTIMWYSIILYFSRLFQKLSKLSSDATNESDSREGTPLLDEKPAVKSPVKPPVKPVCYFMFVMSRPPVPSLSYLWVAVCLFCFT